MTGTSQNSNYTLRLRFFQFLCFFVFSMIKIIVLRVVTRSSTFSNIEITLLAERFKLFFLSVFAVETSRCQCDFVFEKVVRFLQNTCEQYKNEIQSQDFLR